MSNIVGVVILYNPEESIIYNIGTYIGILDKLYVLDNSPTTNDKIISQLSIYDNIVYVKNVDNMGISLSLNYCLNQLEEQYDWLLTMDQDSYFYEGNAEHLVNSLYSICKRDTAILSASHVALQSIDEYRQNGMEKCQLIMTSGNLLNIQIAKTLGGFDENLFIDEVDHEYCYRATKNGFKIYRDNDCVLIHNLGEESVFSLLGWKVKSKNHNYMRRYYQTRNLLYLRDKHLEYRSKSPLGRYFRTTIRAILLVDEDKYRKLKSLYEGYKDYQKAKMGKKEFDY